MENVEVNITQVSLPILNVQVVQNRAPVMTAEIVIGVNGGGGQSITFGDTMTGAGTPTDPVNVSEDILQDINNANELAVENAREISNVRNLIPATATPDNKLADQGFVNSSIQTATAYFRGDWETWADVPSDPELYPADATGNHTPITNDYMVVIADEKTNGGTWRYKYTGVWAEQGKDGWKEEYQINETPLTAAQLAALNSGITADAVASFVKNTDYASWSKAGIVRVSEDLGTTANGYGYLQALTGTLTKYNSASNHYFIGKGTLENIKYDLVKRSITTNDITLTDEEKAAAQSWLGIESGGGGDYLPLTGGTLTGDLFINQIMLEGYYSTLYIGKSNASRVFGFNIAAGSLEPMVDNFGRIGMPSKRWAYVHTTKLNNGADLIVPTEGGTLARVEDIAAAVGDISTALTAILGE